MLRGAAFGAVLAASGLACVARGTARLGALRITHAAIPAPPAPTEASVFLMVDNGSETPVALVDATSPAADSVRMHEMVNGRMTDVARLNVAAHGRLLLAPGGYHLMLHGLRRRLAVGDSVALELRFDPGGPVTIRAPVLTYTDAVSHLPAR
jgi:copper(I)-binding protein